MNWKKIIQELLEKGWTQGEIASAVGLKQPTIAGLLSGSQKDMRWHNGEQLRALHAQVFKEDSIVKPLNRCRNDHD